MKIQTLAHRMYGNRLFKDSLWTLLGNAFGKGLTVLSGIIVARLLGKDVYGEFGLLRNTLIIIAVFSTMGLGYTATVFISEAKEKTKNIVYPLVKVIELMTVIFSGFISLCVFFFSNELALFLEDEALDLPLKILSVIILFNAVTTSQIGILAGLKAFKGTAVVNLVSGILNFILTCWLTFIYGFVGALSALLISQIINCLLNSGLLRISLKDYASAGMQLNLVAPIIKNSLPVALQEMVVSFTHWLFSIVLLKISNYGEVGLVTVASQWEAILLFVPIALRNVTLSHMSSSGKEDADKIMKRMLLVNVMVSLVPTLLFYIFNNLFDMMYGPTFKNVGIVITLACVYATVNSVFAVFASTYMARKRNWTLFTISFLRGIFKFPVLILFVYYICIRGAYAFFIASIIMEIVAVATCYYLLNNDRSHITGSTQSSIV